MSDAQVPDVGLRQATLREERRLATPALHRFPTMLLGDCELFGSPSLTKKCGRGDVCVMTFNHGSNRVTWACFNSSSVVARQPKVTQLQEWEAEHGVYAGQAGVRLLESTMHAALVQVLPRRVSGPTGWRAWECLNLR